MRAARRRRCDAASRSTFETGADEVVVLPLAGALRGRCRGRSDPARRAGRASWSGPTDFAVRAARHRRSRSRAAGGGRFAVCTRPRRAAAPGPLRGRAGRAGRAPGRRLLLAARCATSPRRTVRGGPADRGRGPDAGRQLGLVSAPQARRGQAPDETELEEIYHYVVAEARRVPGLPTSTCTARPTARSMSCYDGRDRGHGAGSPRLARTGDGGARLRPVLPQRDGRSGRAGLACRRSIRLTAGSATRGRGRGSIRACRSAIDPVRTERPIGGAPVRYDRATAGWHARRGSSPWALANLDVIPDGLKRRWPDIRPEDQAAVMAVLERGVLGGVGAPEMTALEQEWAAFVGRSMSACSSTPGRPRSTPRCTASGVGPATRSSRRRTRSPGRGSRSFSSWRSRSSSTSTRGPSTSIPAGSRSASARGRGPSSRSTSAACRRTSTRSSPSPSDIGSTSSRTPARHMAPRITAARSDRSGVVGCYSLNSSKILTGGEGGLFVADDPDILARARRLRTFGEDIPELGRLTGWNFRPYTSHSIGWNYRHQEMPAALARSQLQRLPEYIATGQRNAARLTELLAGVPGIRTPRRPRRPDLDVLPVPRPTGSRRARSRPHRTDGLPRRARAGVAGRGRRRRALAYPAGAGLPGLPGSWRLRHGRLSGGGGDARLVARHLRGSLPDLPPASGADRVVRRRGSDGSSPTPSGSSDRRQGRRPSRPEGPRMADPDPHRAPRRRLDHPSPRPCPSHPRTTSRGSDGRSG